MHVHDRRRGTVDRPQAALVHLPRARHEPGAGTIEPAQRHARVGMEAGGHLLPPAAVAALPLAQHDLRDLRGGVHNSLRPQRCCRAVRRDARRLMSIGRMAGAPRGDARIDVTMRPDRLLVTGSIERCLRMRLRSGGSSQSGHLHRWPCSAADVVAAATTRGDRAPRAGPVDGASRRSHRKMTSTSTEFLHRDKRAGQRYPPSSCAFCNMCASCNSHLLHQKMFAVTHEKRRCAGGQTSSAGRWNPDRHPTVIK